MKRIVVLSVLAVILAFLLPPVLSPGRQYIHNPEGSEALPSPTPTATVPSSAEDAQAHSVLDRDIVISVYDGGEVTQRSMAEYLPLALAGEMPASFQGEALKAQAVALRTYILYCAENHKSSHPAADVCTASGCCTAYTDEDELKKRWGSDFEENYAKICAAVIETDGQYLVYEEKPILAAFHSSSSGQTEDGGNVWGALPYLISVSSPETAEEVRNFESTVEVSPDDFKLTVQRLYPAAALDSEPSAWLGQLTHNSSGRVDSIVIGGVEISGLTVRQMFSLRSTDFSLEYTDGIFVFHTLGYGHGVGMSQYGANAMAGAGCDYTEILAHYYPESQLVVSVRLY